MTILLAYDGEPDTESALNYATKISIATNEPMYILTVVSRDQMDPENLDTSVQEFMEAASQKAVSEGADVHAIIEVGKPDDTILEVADRFQCDAIVVGRPNRSRFDRLVLGSVSQNIVQNATCPVIIVPTASDEDQHEEGPQF